MVMSVPKASLLEQTEKPEAAPKGKCEFSETLSIRKSYPSKWQEWKKPVKWDSSEMSGGAGTG